MLLQEEIEPQFLVVITLKDRPQMDDRGHYPMPRQRAGHDPADSAEYDPEDQRCYGLGC
jgi:hypothetical protein